MGDELKSESRDGHDPADPARSRRRIATRMHSTDEGAGSLNIDCSTPGVRTSWAARGWVDDAFAGPTAHPNRYVAPSDPDATAISGQYSAQQESTGAGLWNKLAEAIRGVWTRPGRERSGCSERHGD